MSILKEFKYCAPTSIKDALRCLKGGGRLLAGGTILINTLKRAEKPPCCVVGLCRVPGLTGVRAAQGNIVIGAMTTLAELESSDILREHLPAWVDACRSIATTPIRHRATIGGNIACRFFWTDLSAVLIAFEAKVVVMTSRGLRRSSVEDYLSRAPGPHILLRVEVPKFTGRSFVRRHTRAMDVDIPILVVAGRAHVRPGEIESIRCVVNLTTARPFVLEAAGDYLNKKGCVEAKAFDAALTCDLAGQKIDAFKLHLIKEDIRRFIEECRSS
jgi:carbon-monoxide dehydrogenase medium subunit